MFKNEHTEDFCIKMLLLILNIETNPQIEKKWRIKNEKRQLNAIIFRVDISDMRYGAIIGLAFRVFVENLGIGNLRRFPNLGLKFWLFRW